MTLYPKLILDALAQVKYPGNGKNLVEAGMVDDNIRIDGQKVSFIIIFPKKPDPFMKSVTKAAEAAVKAFASEDVETTVNVVYKPKEEKAEAPKPLAGAKVIAVSSGKGGVGKSTVAANLAISLSRLGYRVGLLDADIFGPSVPTMFSLEGHEPMGETVDGKQLIVPAERYGIKILSIGFFVKPEQATVWRGPMASNAVKQLITEANWGDLDYFVIDTPPGTSDIHLTLMQTLDIAGAIIISTPQKVALADARKGVDMYRNEKINIPILGIVENMAWFTPQELPDNKYYIFGKDGAKKMAEDLGLKVLGQIPLVQSVCESGDNGQPIALDATSPVAQAFLSLASTVTYILK
jgi:ATP-binding protein involved in chromosome partitioning